MSYADATLDLTSVPVACLTGQNGAGKSALLDAITWALWEEARASSDELMRLGEKETWVDLVFNHEGDKYRVRRARQKVSVKAGSKASSKGTLDFQVFSFKEVAVGVGQGLESARESGSWRSLTSASMRETQKTITELLRMDFETFINSAYLRQGKADEFTTRAPADRKQILSEILGLSYFDRLQEKAKEHSRALKLQSEVLAAQLSFVTDQETKLVNTNQELVEAETLFKEKADALLDMENISNLLRERISQMNIFKERLKKGESETATLDKDIASIGEQYEDQKKRLDQVDQLLSKTPEIEAAALRFQEIKTNVEKLDKNSFALQELTVKKNEYQTELAKIRSRLEVECDTTKTQLKELEDKLDKLKKDTLDQQKIEEAFLKYKESIALETELSLKQEAFTRLTNRANELKSLVAEQKIRLEADLSLKRLALADLQKILESKQNLENEKLFLEDETKALEKLEAAFEDVEERGLKLKTLLESKKGKIETLHLQQKERQSKISELHAHADSSICPLCSAPIVDRAAVIARYHEQNKSQDEEIKNIEIEIDKFEFERDELRKQYSTLRAKLDGRKQLDKQIGQFNEKLQAVERAQTNLDKSLEELKTLESRLQREDFAQIERESLINIKAEIHKLEFDPLIFSSLQSQLRMQRHVEFRHQQLVKDIAEIIKIELQTPSLSEQLRSKTDEISGESYGNSERKNLQEVQTKIASLEYDRNEHKELQTKLAELLPTTNLHRDLQKALEEKPAIEKAESAYKEMLAEKRARKEELTQEQKQLAADLEEFPLTEKKLQELLPGIAGARASKDEAGQRLAVLTAQSMALTEELQSLSQKKLELDLLKSSIDDYQFLAEAFGKKGIQAVIIENAIPEIENEANRILSRLTENKMHIALVTQHKTKTGTTVETLDLVIGDEMGTRNYELFSGGEAFKVNFAVRVALARLLARRAGAKLETLIIDEGFGSQDDDSRERLVRAIKAIQTDFARILVITHMADIKEMFPTQIQVSKVNGASQLEIVY